jgi:hypothetical protein
MLWLRDEHKINDANKKRKMEESLKDRAREDRPTKWELRMEEARRPPFEANEGIFPSPPSDALCGREEATERGGRHSNRGRTRHMI